MLARLDAVTGAVAREVAECVLQDGPRVRTGERGRHRAYGEGRRPQALEFETRGGEVIGRRFPDREFRGAQLDADRHQETLHGG